MKELLSAKQLEFIAGSTSKWNLAHGSVRSGKTVGSTFAFMHDVDACPDNKIYIVGHTFDTAKRNIVNLIMESKELSVYRPFCTWSGKKLFFKDKSITILGAKDEGSIRHFQGDTHSLTLCDEITLYPESIIDMIDTRLSPSHSKGYATMNPSYPSHKVKKWIDKATEGDPNYYALHFTLEDNPYVDQAYKDRIKSSLSGIFYKRNYLGLWCLAEGAIFDFFDHGIHVVNKPPRAAEYWVAGIDYGTSNNFACVLMGVNTGHHTQTGVCRWIEKEYVWNSKKMGRQKTNAEYADDVERFLEPYGLRGIYVDPSAASFKLELQRRGMTVIDADNDVLNGLTYMCSEMCKGNLFVLKECVNTIKELESYVWDNKACERGDERPLKKDDHCVDAMRYCFYTHKVVPYQPYKHSSHDYVRNRFGT